MVVSFEQFKQLDLRIGKVIKVEDIPGSDKLYKLIVDFGGEKRQAVAGLKKFYKPEELEGKKFVFVTNLEHKKLLGVESECMVLAAETGNSIALLQADKDVPEGSKIR